MQNYIKDVTALRGRMVSDISETLREMNHTVIVDDKDVSYTAYPTGESGYVSPEDATVVQVLKIKELSYNQTFKFVFVDENGHRGTPTEISTDELWGICDHLYRVERREPADCK